jgi:hypothetical protein
MTQHPLHSPTLHLDEEINELELALRLAALNLNICALSHLSMMQQAKMTVTKKTMDSQSILCDPLISDSPTNMPRQLDYIGKATVNFPAPSVPTYATSSWSHIAAVTLTRPMTLMNTTLSTGRIFTRPSGNTRCFWQDIQKEKAMEERKKKQAMRRQPSSSNLSHPSPHDKEIAHMMDNLFEVLAKEKKMK